MPTEFDYFKRLSRDYFGIMAGFLEIINPELLDHSKRVADGSKALAQAVGWPEQAVERVYIGALVHDLGYLATQDQAHKDWTSLESGKPEHENLKETHPVLGEKVLRNVETLKAVRPIVRHHHEHFDGSGFPDGLKGKEIPAEARLVAVVDFFERVITPRSDMSVMPAEEAELILREDAGIIYDPVMVPLFLERIVPTGLMEPPNEQA